jgi:hypothetical protein
MAWHVARLNDETSPLIVSGNIEAPQYSADATKRTALSVYATTGLSLELTIVAYLR